MRALRGHPRAPWLSSLSATAGGKRDLRSARNDFSQAAAGAHGRISGDASRFIVQRTPSLVLQVTNINHNADHTATTTTITFGGKASVVRSPAPGGARDLPSSLGLWVVEPDVTTALPKRTLCGANGSCADVGWPL